MNFNMHTFSLPVIASLAIVLTACGGSSDSSSSNKGSSNNGTNTNAKPVNCTGLSPTEMLAAVNKIRSESRFCGTHNYPATHKLKWNTQLATAASDYATYMAENNKYGGSEHLGTGASTYKERIKATGYGVGNVTSYTGENIAAGQSTLDDTMSELLSSKGHCENIMRAEAKDFGMACGYNANSDKKTYWVQTFGVITN